MRRGLEEVAPSGVVGDAAPPRVVEELLPAYHEGDAN